MNTTYNVSAAHAKIDADRHAVGMASVLEQARDERKPSKCADILFAAKGLIAVFLLAQGAFGILKYLGV